MQQNTLYLRVICPQFSPRGCDYIILRFMSDRLTFFFFFLQVLFSTETFAMGVNAPARTVSLFSALLLKLNKNFNFFLKFSMKSN